MFSRIGTSELILILVIALVIFGPSKLPEIGRAIGTSIKEFKKSIGSISEDSENNNKKKISLLRNLFISAKISCKAYYKNAHISY